MQSDQTMESVYNCSADRLPHFIRTGLERIDGSDCGFVNEAEYNALLAFIDYRLKWLHTRRNEPEIREVIDSIIDVCHEHGKTPLYQITGSEDICPETIEFKGGKGKLFFGRNSINANCDEHHLYLFSTGQMRCITTFFIEGYQVVDYHLSDNFEWVAMSYSPVAYPLDGEKWHVCIWDLKHLAIAAHIVTDGCCALCVLDDGHCIYSDGTDMYRISPYSEHEPTVIQTDNRHVVNITVLDQRQMLIIGDRSMLLDVETLDVTCCDMDFSLDSRSFKNKAGNILVLSGCMQYSVDANGHTSLVKILNEGISIPRKPGQNIGFDQNPEVKQLVSDGGVLSISFGYNHRMDTEEMIVKIDERDDLELMDYSIRPCGIEGVTAIPVKKILDDYRNIRPVMSVDPREHLLTNDETFMLNAHENCIYQIVVVERTDRVVKALSRKIGIEIHCPADIMAWYVLDQNCVRDIIVGLEPMEDDGEWTRIEQDYRLFNSSNGPKVYLKEVPDIIKTDASISFVNDHYLNVHQWFLLSDGAESCLYARLSNGVYCINSNGCTFFEDCKVLKPLNNSVFLSDKDTTWCLNANGSASRTMLHVGNAEIIANMGNAQIVRGSKGYQFIDGDVVYDLNAEYFKHPQICITGDCRFASYSNGIVSIIDASSNKVCDSIDIFNSGRWVPIGSYANLRFDLASTHNEVDGCTIQFAELKSNGEFRIKDDIVLKLDTSEGDPYDKPYSEKRLVATYGNDVITLRRENGVVRLDHLKIEKNGLKDTNNSMKASTLRFNKKFIMPMRNANKVVVCGMGFSNDESDRKHKGKNAIEVRIVDLDSGLREENLLFGVQEYKIENRSKIVLFSNNNYVAAECVHNFETFVSLWNLRTGKRYPEGSDPVMGHLTRTTDNEVVVLEYSDLNVRKPQYQVTYNLRMEAVGRKKMNVIPYGDGMYRYDGELECDGPSIVGENTAMWNIVDVERTVAEPRALPRGFVEEGMSFYNLRMGLYCLNDGVLSEPTLYETTIGSMDSIDAIKETVKKCFKIQSYRGSYLIQYLAEQPRDRVFEERTFELAFIAGGSVMIIRNVHNPFDSEYFVENTACIGEDGCSFIEESGGTLELKLIGPDGERMIGLPEDLDDPVVMFANKKGALLYSKSRGRFLSDWNTVKRIDVRGSEPNGLDESPDIDFVDEKWLIECNAQMKTSDPSMLALIDAEKTCSKPFTKINQGVYIHETD